MSPPSPNPTSIFKWEDSSALEHSCWACPTKSNSPKAINSCYGIHSIPCMAYHSTMHAIGCAHRCSGCIMSREMHDVRHREIAELVAEYAATKVVLQDPPTRRRALSELPANMRLRNFVPAENNHIDHENDHNDQIDEIDDNFSNHDTASTTTSSENSNILKLTKSEQRERKRVLKAEKSLRKAAKNEARHAVAVTSEDVQRVAHILHGGEHNTPQAQTHPLATDKTIEDVIARNLGFVKQIKSHKQALRETVRAGREEEHERRLTRRRVSEGIYEDTETEAVVDAILIKLGIDVTASECSPTTGRSRNKFVPTPSKQRNAPHKKTCSPHNSNSQSKLISRLREAIKDDLEKHENDLRQTYIRAGGFFRYAGKAVFERMTEIAKNIDLQTGEEWAKKRKREAGQV